MTLPSYDELVNRFAAQRSWEDKYRQLILLSRELPAFDCALKAPENEVHGCENRVWLVAEKNSDGTLSFSGDSEGRIVKGLLAILLIACNNQTAEHIAALDFQAMFSALGINEQLSTSRQNGLNALISRIKQAS